MTLERQNIVRHSRSVVRLRLLVALPSKQLLLAIVNMSAWHMRSIATNLNAIWSSIPSLWLDHAFVWLSAFSSQSCLEIFGSYEELYLTMELLNIRVCCSKSNSCSERFQRIASLLASPCTAKGQSLCKLDELLSG